jgi:hypothetical protein
MSDYLRGVGYEIIDVKLLRMMLWRGFIAFDVDWLSLRFGMLDNYEMI